MSIDWDALVTGPCMMIFGEQVTYTEPGHRPQVITGVFDEAYLPLLPMGGGRGQEPMQFGAAGNVTDASPMLGVQLSQFHSLPKKNAAIQLGPQRGNALYTIKEVQLDGHGSAKLILMEA